MAQRIHKRLLRDIDGVTADFFAECRKTWGEPQVGTYSLEEAYPMISDKEIWDFIQLPGTYERLRPIEGAIRADKILRSAGWEIVNVTCRPANVTRETCIWLWNCGLAPEDQVIPALFVSRREKIGLASDFSAIVEDNHEIARAMSKVHTCVYLFDWPFNQGPCGSAIRIRRPYWENVLQELLKE